MIDRRFDNLWDLLEAAREASIKHQCEVVWLDDPKHLLLGIFCQSSDEYFHIQLSRIRRRRFGVEDEKLLDLFTTLIVHPEDRHHLAKMASWNGQGSLLECIERYSKLKAFW